MDQLIPASRPVTCHYSTIEDGPMTREMVVVVDQVDVTSCVLCSGGRLLCVH